MIDREHAVSPRLGARLPDDAALRGRPGRSSRELPGTRLSAVPRQSDAGRREPVGGGDLSPRVQEIAEATRLRTDVSFVVITDVSGLV